MSAGILTPKARKLREAVADYCEKGGVNAATISAVTEKMVGLLSSRWEHICDLALAVENEGKVNVGFRLSFDMTRKTPVGMITLSFAQRTRDEANFIVEDPDQPTLPFQEPIRPAVPPAAASNPPRRTRPSRRRSPEAPA